MIQGLAKPAAHKLTNTQVSVMDRGSTMNPGTPKRFYATSETSAPKVTNKAEVMSMQIDRQDTKSTATAAAQSLTTRSWRTTVLRLGPLAGGACMMTAIASIAAALGILVGSRGAAVTTWTVCEWIGQLESIADHRAHRVRSHPRPLSLSAPLSQIKLFVLQLLKALL